LDIAGEQRRISSAGPAVRDVVRAVIADVAPEELPVVDGLRRFDDETVMARLTSRRRGREPLGFGLEEMVYLATPVVWVALDECVRRMVGRTMSKAPSRLRRWLRRIFRRPPGQQVVPELSAEQVAEVRRRVLELSAQAGLGAERAEALANRLAVELLLPANALAPSGGDDGGDGADERRDPA